MRIRSTVIFLGLLLAGSAASADGDAAAGKLSASQCVACHGLNGISTDPQYPKLAGQHADYLARALYDYQSGKRNNAIMAVFAANLSDEDIENLAAWYASLGNGVVDF